MHTKGPWPLATSKSSQEEKKNQMPDPDFRYNSCDTTIPTNTAC